MPEMKPLPRSRFAVFLLTLVLAVLAVPAAGAEQNGPAELVALETMTRPPLLEIRYATAYNFTGTQLYPFPGAWLRPEAVAALEKVQAELKAEGLGLKLFDAYRPLSVQQKMWDLIQDERYVSDPARNRGRHTRGTAVDVTLIDAKGDPLPMPTGYDDFTEKAHSDHDGPEVSPEAKANREKLADVMTRHGFEAYPYEWWHFDLTGWKEYPPLDVGFEALRGKFATAPATAP